METTLRPASRLDTEHAGRICYEAFRTISQQHAFPPDFPDVKSAVGLFDYMISRPDVHGVVAEHEKRVVGSNFLWKDGPVAGVGPITVDPAVQNARIGRRLMENVLQHAREEKIPAVRLVQAAYHT